MVAHAGSGTDGQDGFAGRRRRDRRARAGAVPLAGNRRPDAGRSAAVRWVTPGCARRQGSRARHHRDAAGGRRAAGGRPRGRWRPRPLPARRRRVPARGRPLPLPHRQGQGDRPARVRPGPRGRLQKQLRRRLPPRRDARRQVHVAPAAFPTAPDAGRGRHHRQPGLPDPVGQPRHRAAGAGPRGPVALGAGSAVIQMDGTPIRTGRRPGRPGSMGKGCLWPAPGDRGGAVPPFPDSSRHGNAVRFPDACGGTPVTDGHRACEACAAARGGAADPVAGGGRRVPGLAPPDAGDPATAPRHPVRRAVAHPTERWAAPGTFPGTPACRRTRTPAGTRRLRRGPASATGSSHGRWTEGGTWGPSTGCPPPAGCRAPAPASGWPTSPSRRHPSGRPGRRADAEAVQGYPPRQPDGLRRGAGHGGPAGRRRRTAHAAAADGDAGPGRKRRKPGPRQRYRPAPRRGRRRGQAPLQPPGPDETAPVPGAGCPHHRPPPVHEHVPAPAGGVPHGMAGDQPDGPGGAAAHVRQPDAARRPSARHRDRLRRSVTPPPGDSPPFQPGSAATAPPEPHRR